MHQAPLLKVENLTKHFPVTKGVVMAKQVGTVRAVDDVSFELGHGETLAIVGESGCGKSTTGRLVLRLLEPTAGNVEFEEERLFELGPHDLRHRRRHMQIIFQDPFGSLNPRMTVGEIVGRPMDLHNIAHGKAKRERVRELLSLVGLAPWHEARYPHEFSGGQRQRIGIARALAVDPKLIVCDEPVSALDVSVQAQVVNLLQDLQERFNLSYLFIAHDLAVVKHIADRVAVMYLGRMVEIADKQALYSHPRHPYTRALMSAIPLPEPHTERKLGVLEGDVPSPLNPPDGCRFHTRCPFARDRCKVDTPTFETIVPGHQVACHYWREIPDFDPLAVTPKAGAENMYEARATAWRRARDAMLVRQQTATAS